MAGILILVKCWGLLGEYRDAAVPDDGTVGVKGVLMWCMFVFITVVIVFNFRSFGLYEVK